MCGIAGIFAYAASAGCVDPGELRAIRDQMQRRGPDGCGEWFTSDGRLGFGHRRLSIIDLLDRAAQPMRSSDGLRTVTFNGEIYNYRALREELLARGRSFRTESDTEVLLELYALEGDAMVERLRGMFAFALYDAQRGGVLLARDPYGIKPLYYADDGTTLRFASQVKALLAGGRIARALDPAAQVGFYMLGSVPEPFTIRRDIKALPAGSTLYVDAAGARAPRPYFSIAATLHEARLHGDSDPTPIAQRVREALADSVRHHQVADVKVGAFLSAGIDSGSLLGLMAEQDRTAVEAVTLGFAEFEGRAEDEAPLACQVAARYGATHSVRVVSREEFEADLPALLDAMDQPSIDGINSWFVSKAAHEAGLKVAVSGLGGDELFGGYPAFRDVPRWERLMRWPQRVPGLGRGLRALAAPALQRLTSASPKLAGMAEYGGSFEGAYLLRRGLFMPWELDQILDAATLDEGLARLSPLEHIRARLDPDPGSPFARVATLEAELYMRNQLLRDADWASMAHSLEVRVPLVDAWLLRALAPAFGHSDWQLGKELIAKAPRRPLPNAVLHRAKTGFGTPIANWVQTSQRLCHWRSVSALTRPGCHWSRRFAYAMATGLD